MVVLALSARSETASAFNRDILKNRHQLMLYGISLLMILLPLNLDFLQKFLGLTNLNTNQVIICLVFAHCFAAGGRSDQVLHAPKSQVRHNTIIGGG